MLRQRQSQRIVVNMVSPTKSKKKKKKKEGKARGGSFQKIGYENNLVPFIINNTPPPMDISPLIMERTPLMINTKNAVAQQMAGISAIRRQDEYELQKQPPFYPMPSQASMEYTPPPPQVVEPPVEPPVVEPLPKGQTTLDRFIIYGTRPSQRRKKS